MNFDDLKDRFREFFQSLAGRIQESSTWGQLVEKYQDLSPSGQKAALAGACALIALLLFLIPWTFYSASEDRVVEFEAKKELMRELYRVSRAVSQTPQGPPPISTGELRATIEAELTGAGLQQDQRKGVVDFENPTAKSGLSKALKQPGLSVSLAKLTLQQLTDLGRKFEQNRQTVKMVGIEIRAGQPDPHYFDVTYKLVAFNLPPEVGPAGGNKSFGSKPNFGNKKNGPKDAEEE